MQSKNISSAESIPPSTVSSRTGAAYIRVSTEDQIEYSPDSQIHKIREYAQTHHIILPQKYIFLDEGISGRSAAKRPAFMEMIQTARQKPKPFDVILLWKFSRFARNRQDSIMYKSMLRKECGIDVISITEQLSDDPTSILIEALLEAMDEYYSINLGQEVKRGMNEKFSRGGIVAPPPYGYRLSENSTVLEPDPVQAEIVRSIFVDYLSGLSCRRIALLLNDRGILTRRGNPFEGRTIKYILTNPVYIGKFRRNLKGYDPSDRFHQGKEVVLADAPHCPVISEEVFYAVQEKMRQKKCLLKSDFTETNLL